MVTIRLSRGGSKKRPFYSILVADQRRSTRGRFIERLGFYNPMISDDKGERLRLDVERADHWVNLGAKPSDSVARLITQARQASAEKASAEQTSAA